MSEPRELPTIACSLTSSEAAERGGEWRALGRSALVGSAREPGRAVLRYRAEAGVADALRDLARRERECCPFFDMDVSERGEEVVLSIGAPEAAEPILDQLVAASRA